MKYLLLLIPVFFVSCDNRKDINCLYRGAVVYDWRSSSIPSHKILTLKYKGEMIEVSIYEIDHDYKVGDTINKPCIK